MLHLNGQNLRLAAKNGRTSKTPGHHLSVTHGKEVVGRLKACSATQEGTAQLDLLLNSPRPHSEREVRNQQVRRPLTLAPLELSEEVREAQRQKLKFIQEEAQSTSCNPDVTVNETLTRKVKSSVRQRPVKASVCPSASTEPLKAQNRSPRPRLKCSNPIEQTKESCVEDVVCQGTPAPLYCKPGLSLPSLRVTPQEVCGAQGGQHQTPSTLAETGKRRLRLRRAQCLEEDQQNSNVSTQELSAGKGKMAQGVQGRGQRVERISRGQHHAGKGIKQLPAASWEYVSVRKSHHEDCNQQPARCSLNRQLAEGGSSDRALEGVKPSASNWRSKSKKPFITSHNSAVPL